MLVYLQVMASFCAVGTSSPLFLEDEARKSALAKTRHVLTDACVSLPINPSFEARVLSESLLILDVKSHASPRTEVDTKRTTTELSRAESKS